VTRRRRCPGIVGGVMAEMLIAIVSFVLFVMGFLAGVLLVIAVQINLEDKATTKRMLATQRLDGSILLHEVPQGRVACGVRRLLVGQRNGPTRILDDQRRENR
jgi:hypothetical protein